MCIRDRLNGVSLADFVHSIRDAARILGLGLSEEEIVQIILEGVTPQERSRLVFAERPRSFVDLDKLCVLSRAIQGNDELRGSGGTSQPDFRRGERRVVQSQPRPGQSASTGAVFLEVSFVSDVIDRGTLPGIVRRVVCVQRFPRESGLQKTRQPGDCLLYTSRCV